MNVNSIIKIDGQMGEGGGQILRACLALSLALKKPFHLTDIRGRRPKPGLKRQHLACVKAAGEISGAEVQGAEINSTELFFQPGPLCPGDYSFDIGGGGSCTLVLQALLPPMMAAGKQPSRIKVSGGTHVPMAPVFEFFNETLLPHLELLGGRFSSRLIRPGFMQIGGGLIEVEIEPADVLRPFYFKEIEAGEVVETEAFIRSYGLDECIAEREAGVIKQMLGLTNITAEHYSPSETGPGNMVVLKVRRSGYTTVFSGIAQRGVTAEKVARQAVNRLKQFLNAAVPVEAHLADQLLVPLALAGGGGFMTEQPTLHTLTVLELLPKFIDLNAKAVEIKPGAWLIEIER